MTKTATAPIEGEVIDDSAPQDSKQSRAVAKAAPRRAANVQVAAPVDPLAIYQMAIERGADISVVKQTYELCQIVEANNARKAYAAAIAAVRPLLPVISKDRRVAFESKKGGADTDYAHESLAQISRQIDGILGDHGLSYRYKTDQQMQASGGSMLVYVTCLVSHSLGHEEPTTLFSAIDISGNKNHIQAIGSAVTYLQRYTLKAALGLAAAEDEDDGRGAPDPQKPKPSVPRASASGGGADTTKQQQTASQEKPKPHAISTANMKFTQWAGRYVELAKTADTVAELQEWDKLNDVALTETYNKARPVYDELNAAYQKHLHMLKAKEAPPRRDDPISSGRPPADGSAPQESARASSKWTFPDPKTDYETFLSWATDKLRSWVTEFGDIEEFWNEVIEPAMVGAFPSDKDDLMSEYRRAEHRLGG